MNPHQRELRAKYNDAVRQRIDLIAADAGLPRSAVAKVRGRLRPIDLANFAEENRVALNWLICGSLTGLARTVAARTASDPPA